MQQYVVKANRRPTMTGPSPAASSSPPSPVVTMMQQPVSSSAVTPVFLATPTGRSSTMFAASKSVFTTPVFSPTSNFGVDVKASDAFSPALRRVSPTSVVSPLEGGIARGPDLPRGIVGIRLHYDRQFASTEMVFEPVNRAAPHRVPMFCSPSRSGNEDDTADVTSPSTAASAVSSPPHSSGSASYLKLRSSRVGSSNGTCYGRNRASTVSPAPASPTPQNLKDNPERLAKVKTEMCRYYELGGLKNCPWGDKCKYRQIYRMLFVAVLFECWQGILTDYLQFIICTTMLCSDNLLTGNYAHGKHELKFNYSSLSLMERSGHITNAKTYLSRPCMTWISTGACPYGRRCAAIHDPSISGPLENPSWLPAASAKTNAQIIVDRFAAHRDSTVHQENPLIAQGIWENCRPSLCESKSTSQHGGRDESEMSWLDTYALICNIGVPTFGSPPNNVLSNKNATRGSQSSSNKLSELQKLCIVSQMRGKVSTFSGSSTVGLQQLHLLHRDFIYAPTHSLHSELCMILQTRYFLILDEDFITAASDKHSIVKEISSDEYNSRKSPWNSNYRFKTNKVIVATEVAFSPKGDSNANVSIWFDAKPIKLEPSQIKRCRRLKQKNKAQLRNGHTAPHSNGALLCRTSTADFPSRAPPDIDPFVPMLPAEDNDENDTFMLAIIDHRIGCLINEKVSHGSLGGDALRKKQQLDKRMKTLQSAYAGMNHFHQKWIWPKREGSEVVNESTLAPPCNIMPYIPSRSSEGSTCSSMWHSFVDTSATLNAASAEQVVPPKLMSCEAGHLSVFQALDNGLPASSSVSRRIPRIKPSSDDKEKENTWREIVLGADGKWKKAFQLYNEKRVASPSTIDPRNMPLSTIPFVQPQSQS